MMDKQRCGNCCYFKASGRECRRYPPQFVGREQDESPWIDDEKTVEDYPAWGFPEVDNETGWCGEWKHENHRDREVKV